MLRPIHTADVHLGARHDDLGEQASAQRERQFAAFTAAVDLALAEKVDLFLIAGDLFDSNVQPKRSVERVAAQLQRLAASKIRTVIIPGTHDCYDRSSIYRTYDLKALAGSTAADDLVTVLTPERLSIHLTACDAIVHGPVFATKRAPYSPLRDLTGQPGRSAGDLAAGHGPRFDLDPRQDRADDVVITTDEVAMTGFDYLALGHWHSSQQSRAGGVTYAYAGAPEAVVLDQDRAGKGLLVELEEMDGRRSVTVQERQVGATRFEKIELDAGANIAAQPALIESLRKKAASEPRPRCAGRRRAPGRPRPGPRRDRGGPGDIVPQGACPGRQRAGPDRGRTAAAGHASPGRSSATSRRASPSSKPPRRQTRGAERQRPKRRSCATHRRLGRLLLAGHEVSL